MNIEVAVFSSAFVISCYRLFLDYSQRKYFASEFCQNYQIGNKKIIDGIITANENPLCKISLIRNYRTVYYDLNLYHSHQSYQSYPVGFPICNPVVCNNYARTTISNHICPNAKLNNINLVFAPNCLVHYTERLIDSDDIIHESIPNNTLISIFAEEVNNTQYIVHSIGPKKNIIKDIGYKYYGISNAMTAIFIGLASISAIGLVTKMIFN